ncbi:hypothetical protein [Methylobacterium nigriterrae]|uniref:hypothetical protein n=1 Tax=Methylobacterium nigriterrae TaxID=3127512 RepID=UPI00301357DB
MTGSSEHELDATESLIAEAEACHAEAVTLIERLSGEARMAAEAECALRQTEHLLAVLDRFWSRSKPASKKP